MNAEPSIQDVMTTVQDVLETIQTFAEHTDRRFDRIETDIADLKTRVTHIESSMVTKDYLDEKLGDLRGDLILLARKQNRKFDVLVEELVMNGQLKQTIADRLLAMEPFASKPM